MGGRGCCFPSLLFGLRPNYGRSSESNGNLLQKGLCTHCCTQGSWAGCWPIPLPETPGHSQASLRTLLLSPGSWCTQGLCVPSKSLFPQFCGSSIIKSHWPPKSNSTGFSVPLLDPQVGKFVVGPRTFLTVWEFLWYNFFALVGHLLGSAMVGLMVTSSKRAYATLCVTQVCCKQGPCPHGRPLLTCASTGDTQTLKGRSGSVSVGSLGPGTLKVLFRKSLGNLVAMVHWNGEPLWRLVAIFTYTLKRNSKSWVCFI